MDFNQEHIDIINYFECEEYSESMNTIEEEETVIQNDFWTNRPLYTGPIYEPNWVVVQRRLKSDAMQPGLKKQLERYADYANGLSCVTKRRECGEKMMDRLKKIQSDQYIVKAWTNLKRWFHVDVI